MRKTRLEQIVNDAATERALMVLVEDVQEAAAANERVRVQVEALASAHGVKMPERP